MANIIEIAWKVCEHFDYILYGRNSYSRLESMQHTLLIYINYINILPIDNMGLMNYLTNLLNEISDLLFKYHL